MLNMVEPLKHMKSYEFSPIVRVEHPFFLRSGCPDKSPPRHCGARLCGAGAAHGGGTGAGLHQDDEPHLGRLCTLEKSRETMVVRGQKTVFPEKFTRIVC